jgi:hypothetical protein
MAHEEKEPMFIVLRQRRCYPLRGREREILPNLLGLEEIPGKAALFPVIVI